jgi:DNA (cytosine-5)-methyltransferase 1
MENNLPRLITIKQASTMLGVSTLTLRNWDKNGKLKALRHPMNNYRVYKREDIESLIENIGTTPVAMIKREPKPAKITKKLTVKHLEE